MLSSALMPGPLTNAGLIDNPYGIDGAPVLGAMAGVSGILLLISEGACIVAALVRFRRARGQEREQLKWVAYAAGVVIVVGLGGVAIEGLFVHSENVLNYTNAFTTASIAFLPIAAGVAILRYRLYDIDRIISRTLAYAIVTALLAGSYIVIVLILQLILPVDRNSPVVVVLSTLAVAAAFGPIRRRIQTFVDSHFNRARYNAAQTLEEFSRTLRDEVDIGRLRSDLLGVVESSFQPMTASLWLKGGASEGR